MEEDHESNCFASVNDDNLNEWNATIKGPTDTPYEGGVFRFLLTLPDNYPFKPPAVKVMTKIFHPNIIDTDICLDTLRNNWTPSLNIQKLLMCISSLLNDPNPDSPLSFEAGEMYRSDRNKYNETAKEWTQIYAME